MGTAIGPYKQADEYQAATKETEVYSEAARDFLYAGYENMTDGEHMLNLMYCAGKLNGEAGEVAEIIFKAFRRGELRGQDYKNAVYELGDVLWYVARLADLFGYQLSDVMTLNIEKLKDRKERNVIKGEGDNR